MNTYRETPEFTPANGEVARRPEDAKSILMGRGVRDSLLVERTVQPSPTVQPTPKNSLTTADIVGRNYRKAEFLVPPASVPVAETEPLTAPLFTPEATAEFRRRWDAIQAGFVDEPRQAVEQADNLVAMTIRQLAEMFADARQRLEGQWDTGQQVTTEELRMALRSYRSYFERLLTL